MMFHGSARPSMMAENSVEHVKGLLLLLFLPKDPKESVVVITGGKASLPTVSNPDGGIG